MVALRPSDWQPKTPPVLVSFERQKEALGQGEALPGNLVVVSTKEDLANLQDLWRAFGVPAAQLASTLTLVLRHMSRLPLLVGL